MVKLISIITPCRNERDNVVACRDRVREVFKTHLPTYEYEHIFADNASSDGTREVLRSLASLDARVKVILNSRNFGAEASMFNALTRTSGDAVMVMIPADLQDPPELLPEFMRHWEEGHKVVYGIRHNRTEGSIMTLIRRAYYRAVAAFSNINIPRNVGEFQLIDRVVVDALKRFEERQPYLRGMIASCGFNALGIEYEVAERARGRSNMNLLRLIDQGLNGLISFSTLPLRVCMLIGVVTSVMSLLYAAASFVVSLVFFRELAPPGIPTMIVALFFFGGVQLFFLGVLGEYILAIHTQVRRRPLVIEEELINLD
ncbi:MAG: glycosyltransferase [Thiotrichales bacterium]|nr:glycosyltransferase [Thiotrichales bacterium]